MYELLKSIEKEIQEVEITEMQHAYRINGVIDLYKNKPTCYDLIANKYDRLQGEQKLLWCIEKLKKYPKREPFKKTEKGRISYQEFKHTAKKNALQLNGQNAEDYHWKQNFDKMGDDDLYFLFHDGKVKIGRSKDPKKRASELSTGLSHKFNIYIWMGKGFIESTLHRCFEEFNTSREWFTDNERIRRFIRRYHYGTLCSHF
jgi:hypothetical protein